MGETRQKGKKAEDLVVNLLHKHQHTTIARNWRFKNWCELDLVTFKGNRIFFFEVRYRHSEYRESSAAEYSFNAIKRRRFLRGVNLFLAQNQKHREFQKELYLVAVYGKSIQFFRI